MDVARNVFIAAHVDDLILVGSSSQLSEVVGEMKQYFTMKVTHPLSASSTQTYVGARYLRQHGDAILELPTARFVTGMLNEHGMQNAKPAVTPAVNRNDDDDESEEASAEEHRSLRRIAGKSQFLAARRPDIAFATDKSFKIEVHTSSVVGLWTTREQLWRHWCDKQKKSATVTSSGRAISVVASGDRQQEHSNQQCAWS